MVKPSLTHINLMLMTGGSSQRVQCLCQHALFTSSLTNGLGVDTTPPPAQVTCVGAAHACRTSAPDTQTPSHGKRARFRSEQQTPPCMSSAYFHQYSPSSCYCMRSPNRLGACFCANAAPHRPCMSSGREAPSTLQSGVIPICQHTAAPAVSLPIPLVSQKRRRAGCGATQLPTLLISSPLGV
jgi:hypothetical protein